MDILDVIRSKRVHLDRLANQLGAAGEFAAIASTDSWIPRPKGAAMKLLLSALADTGVRIKPSSFDAIAVPTPIDFSDAKEIAAALPLMVFIEIKTANQSRVKPGFGGFFFAMTENEIEAAEQLGPRHKVALFNRATGEVLLTSVPEIVSRSRSMTWQLSVQL